MDGVDSFEGIVVLGCNRLLLRVLVLLDVRHGVCPRLRDEEQVGQCRTDDK